MEFSIYGEYEVNLLLLAVGLYSDALLESFVDSGDYDLLERCSILDGMKVRLIDLKRSLNNE